MPALLRGRLAPSIDDFDTGVATLVADILDRTTKPPLGPAPKTVKTNTRTQFSPAATAIAGVFVKRTVNALSFDPLLTRDDLAQETSLTSDDLTDGLYELRTMVRVLSHSEESNVTAEPSLYAAFDAVFHPWYPVNDALVLAADLVNDREFPSDPEKIAQHYGWLPRQLNPALAHLMDRSAIEVYTAQACGN